MYISRRQDRHLLLFTAVRILKPSFPISFIHSCSCRYIMVLNNKLCTRWLMLHVFTRTIFYLLDHPGQDPPQTALYTFAVETATWLHGSSDIEVCKLTLFHLSPVDTYKVCFITLSLRSTNGRKGFLPWIQYKNNLTVWPEYLLGYILQRLVYILQQSSLDKYS